MTPFVLLALMAVVILVLAALVLYLVDRFNGLERDTRDMMRKLQESQVRPPSGPYAGLTGKALWDALSGSATGNLDELTLDGIRKRYRLLLTDHISWIFNEGVGDVGKGLDSVPANTRMMRTPKTQVESWLPPESVADIYRCGQGYAFGDPGELPALRQRLDQVCGQLHNQCALEMLQMPSSLLMPPLPEAGAPAVPALAGGAGSPP